MKTETKLPAINSGEHPALDYLNSVAAPKGQVIDWLETPQGFLRWLVEFYFISDSDRRKISIAFSEEQILETIKKATQLREWFRELLVVIKSRGISAVTSDDFSHLNQILVLDQSYGWLEKTEKVLSLKRLRRWNDLDGILVVLAEQIIDLLIRGDFSLVHRCANPVCTVWFYDHTKGHRRKWCSTAICGNRAKVAAHRNRERCKF